MNHSSLASAGKKNLQNCEVVLLQFKFFPSSIFLLGLFLGIFLTQPITAQNNYAEVEPSPFDFGKMWTFDHAPLDYFEKTYGFRPTEEWLEHARMSSLRFSGYCTASFISSEGLILTNYHCSHGEIGKAMKEGEDLEKTGFYAAKKSEERRVDGLYVRQLVKMEDITSTVETFTANATDDADLARLKEEAFRSAKDKFSTQKDWRGLELEIATYYAGGKYSLYGFKRFDDVRLVVLPEMNVGLYGGDPDNFTYPRYNLDFTLWRVYEDGKPVNSTDFHFKINPDGISEGEPTFLIGNPGQTERYRTVAQLEYDRDYRYKILMDRLNKRYEILSELAKTAPSHALNDQMLVYSNGMKAYGGIIGGMHDPYLMGKKAAMEKHIKSQSTAVANGEDYWKMLAKEVEALKPYAAENSILAPSSLGGSVLLTAHFVARYRQALEGETSEEDIKTLRKQIEGRAATLTEPKEEQYFIALLQELKTYAGPEDKYVEKLLAGRTPEYAAKEMLRQTKFTNEKKLKKLLDSKAKKLKKNNDPILKMANLLVPAYQEATAKFKLSKPKRDALKSKIGGEVFKTYGLSIPPDASFTLRIADGVVKRYDYNGTIAPYKTTFFGLYNRHFANDGAAPWDLSQRWLNPSMNLLKSPLNFISTNDSIGGNSGSPVINKEGELVGLLFDGNIESLSGNFIYDSRANRAISVHAGGLVAAMRYVLQTGEILKEIGQN